MKEHIIKTYSFKELSEEAKEKAIQDHREFEASENIWSNEEQAVLNEFCRIFGVNWKEYDYSYNTHINYDYEMPEYTEELTGQRLATYIWNNYKYEIYQGKYYSSQMIDYNYKFIHSKCTLEEKTLTGYYGGYDILKPLFDFMEKPDSRNLEDLIKDCLYAWLYSCQKDYEYRLSDESIIETIEANDYEFTEEGKLF